MGGARAFNGYRARACGCRWHGAVLNLKIARAGRAPGNDRARRRSGTSKERDTKERDTKEWDTKERDMARSIKVAAAQTGPVLSEDMRPGVEVACSMVKEAAAQGSDIICFSELFLTPFFPNQLRSDYEHFFLKLPNPITQPLVETARRHNIALIRPFGAKSGHYYYNPAAVSDRAGRHLGTYRKTHIPAILPSEAKGGTGSYEKFYFTPGDALPIFQMEGVRFGIQICYDRKFPEGSRALAVQGAEII